MHRHSLDGLRGVGTSAERVGQQNRLLEREEGWHTIQCCRCSSRSAERALSDRQGVGEEGDSRHEGRQPGAAPSPSSILIICLVDVFATRYPPIGNHAIRHHNDVVIRLVFYFLFSRLNSRNIYTINRSRHSARHSLHILRNTCNFTNFRFLSFTRNKTF